MGHGLNDSFVKPHQESEVLCLCFDVEEIRTRNLFFYKETHSILRTRRNGS